VERDIISLSLIYDLLNTQTVPAELSSPICNVMVVPEKEAPKPVEVAVSAVSD